MTVKGLTREQLLDSLVEAAGLPQSSEPAPNDYAPPSPRGELLEQFANEIDPPTRQQTTILQSPALMNGRFLASAVDARQSRTLATLAASKGSAEELVDELFFATLSREPSPEERSPFVDYLAVGGPAKDHQRALADVFWALLNSAEFASNH